MANQATVNSAVKKAKNVYGLSNEEFNGMIDAYSDAIKGSYDRQREDSDRSFAENYAKASNEALSRGMGRSSYALQTLSNIDSEKQRAASTIWDKQSDDILKYASSLQQFMKEYELKQRELDLQQQQLNLQKSAAGGGGRGGRGGNGNGNGNGNGDEGNGVDKALTEYMKNHAGGSILQTLGYTKNNTTTANNNSVLKNPKKSNRQVL